MRQMDVTLNLVIAQITQAIFRIPGVRRAVRPDNATCASSRSISQRKIIQRFVSMSDSFAGNRKACAIALCLDALFVHLMEQGKCGEVWRRYDKVEVHK